MTSKVEHFLAVREGARRRGDRGVYRSITADLARLGYVDPPVHVPDVEAVPESAEVAAHTAATCGAGGGGWAVIHHIDALIAQDASGAKPAANRGGRRKLPRCEHDKIVGRCRQCAAAEGAEA